MVIIVCPECKAPTCVPTSVEKAIEEMRGYTCWDCGQRVKITSDLKNYIKATRLYGNQN